jgi:transposase
MPLPCVQELLSQGNLARSIVAVVEGLDLSDMEGVYSGRGSKPYHPALLLALLIYAYATGCFSSRKIERGTYDSVAFRFIACNSHPDHDTLATFRRRFKAACEAVFVQVLRVAPLPR